MKKIIILILLAISSSAHADPRIISITGNGVFEYPAEIIKIDFSVYNKSTRDTKEAKDEVERSSAIIIGSLIQLGIDEKDIFSPSFKIDIDEQYDKNDCPKGNIPFVSRDMQILLRDTKLYRQVIDAIVANGATKIDSIEAEVENFEEYENRAMLAAINDAKRQAEFLVSNLGGKLGKIHSIGEKRIRKNSNIEEVVVTGARASARNIKPYDFKPAPVEVSASIYVEFEIE